MSSLKLIASVVSLSLILLLVIAGPAGAFIFDFAVNNNFPILGDLIKFEVSAEIEPSEFLDIQTFTLEMQGPENVECKFYPNSTLISGCNGITIENTETTNYQYGYGFLPGVLRYNIEMDSSTLSNGEYSTRLIAQTPSESIETSSQNLMIVSLSDPVEICSVRAEEGEVEINGEVFDGRNKINLFASSKNSRSSKGSFTAQERRDRVSYKFTVDEARRTTGDIVYFDVHGDLSVNRETSSESATIIFNTKTFELELRGNNFNVSGMKVNFARC